MSISEKQLRYKCLESFIFFLIKGITKLKKKKNYKMKEHTISFFFWSTINYFPLPSKSISSQKYHPPKCLYTEQNAVTILSAAYVTKGKHNCREMLWIRLHRHSLLSPLKFTGLSTCQDEESWRLNRKYRNPSIHPTLTHAINTPSSTSLLS